MIWRTSSTGEKNAPRHSTLTKSQLEVILVEVPVPIPAASCLATRIQGEQRRNRPVLRDLTSTARI
jgi:hypothetical protein